MDEAEVRINYPRGIKNFYVSRNYYKINTFAFNYFRIRKGVTA